jgi:hypothetical protein
VTDDRTRTPEEIQTLTRSVSQQRPSPFLWSDRTTGRMTYSQVARIWYGIGSFAVWLIAIAGVISGAVVATSVTGHRYYGGAEHGLVGYGIGTAVGALCVAAFLQAVLSILWAIAHREPSS